MAKVIARIWIDNLQSVLADPPTPEVRDETTVLARYLLCDEADTTMMTEKSLKLANLVGTNTLNTWWDSVVDAVFAEEGLTPP